jgi:hypothetical protein
MVSIGKGVVGLVGVLVAIILFGALMPLVTDTIDGSSATGTVYTLLSNMPLFLVLGIVIAVIVGALAYLKAAD